MASKKVEKHLLEGTPVQTVKATFDPHNASQRTLGRGLSPAAMSGAHFNPGLARRSGDGDLALRAMMPPRPQWLQEPLGAAPNSPLPALPNLAPPLPHPTLRA